MPRPYLNPSWLFLLAGLAIIASTVLVGANAGLDDVRWQRQRAIALETHRIERLHRYHAYLDALERHDPDLVLALAASELNELPADRVPLDSHQQHRTVFASLEPTPLKLPSRTINDSHLARLATGEATRPWLLAAGAVALLVALLPPARPRA